MKTFTSLALVCVSTWLGCTGDAGAPGAAGAAGPAGPAGPQGSPGAATTADGGALAPQFPDRLELPGPTFYPESLNASSDGTIYVGSLGTGAIAKFAPGTSVPTTFLPAGGDVKNVTGVLVDDANRLLYACAVNLSTSPPSTLGVRAYKLDDRSLVKSYPLSGPGFCNDMALDTAGNLFVADSFGKVHRLAKGGSALEVWSADPLLAPSSPSGFGADGIVVDGDSVLVNTFSDARLLRIPIDASGKAGAVTSIAVTPALSAPDGMRLVAPNTLMLVGASGMMKVSITGATATATPFATRLDAPTSLVKSGDSWWVTEGQVPFLLGAPGSPKLPFYVERITASAD